MIIQDLHREPMGLDSVQHRQLKLDVPVSDWSLAAKLNALFVAVGEFGEACREFPIVFVKVGQNEQGKDQVAPIAVMGLVQGDNLFVEGSEWRGRYMPAVLAAYPFCIAQIDADRFAVCVDKAHPGVGGQRGIEVFDALGQPSQLLVDMQKHLESLEAEVQRTRLIGDKLVELGLLQDMRFDATLPDGRQHTVDGFLTVDEKKMQDLPDAVVGELHRNGMLGLIHLHWVSLGNMRRLVDWHVKRAGTAAAAHGANGAGAALAAAPKAAND